MSEEKGKEFDISKWLGLFLAITLFMVASLLLIRENINDYNMLVNKYNLLQDQYNDLVLDYKTLINNYNILNNRLNDANTDLNVTKLIEDIAIYNANKRTYDINYYNCTHYSADLVDIFTLLEIDAVMHCGFLDGNVYYVIDDNCKDGLFETNVKKDSYHAWVATHDYIIESTYGYVYNREVLSWDYLNE